jgi:hypothetical protein
MKKLILLVLLAITILSFSADPLFAEKKKEISVGVLNPTSFVVVQSRGADNSSVLLYQIYDGKLNLMDILVIDGDFGDVSRPTVRVLRATQHSPRN